MKGRTLFERQMAFGRALPLGRAYDVVSATLGLAICAENVLSRKVGTDIKVGIVMGIFNVCSWLSDVCGVTAVGLVNVLGTREISRSFAFGERPSLHSLYLYAVKY